MRSQHGAEPQDHGPRPERLVVCRDQPFGCDLRRPVEGRLYREWRELVDRYVLGISIHCAGRGVDEPRHARSSHCVDDRGRAQEVGLQVPGWILGAVSNVGVGGEMDDDVRPGDGPRQQLRVEDIALDQAQAWVIDELAEDLDMPGAEVVDDGNGMAPGYQRLAEVAADKAAPAGYDDVHGIGIEN